MYFLRFKVIVQTMQPKTNCKEPCRKRRGFSFSLMETAPCRILQKTILMKFKLIASTIALVAFANLGYGQDTKPKKINPSEPALHRVPPPPPKFIAPVIVSDEPAGITKKDKKLAPPPPPMKVAIGEVAPPPPPVPPVKVAKISIKDAPILPSKTKN